MPHIYPYPKRNMTDRVLVCEYCGEVFISGPEMVDECEGYYCSPQCQIMGFGGHGEGMDTVDFITKGGHFQTKTDPGSMTPGFIDLIEGI